jgi:hypothetical protein
MGIEQEGSLSFRVKHEDKDWATNRKPYDFPPIQAGPVRAHFVKHPTGKIEIRVAGPLGVELMFAGTIPPVREEGLTVSVTWSAQQVRLFLDGRPFKTVQLSDYGGPGNGGAAGSARPAPDDPPPSDA